uniref:Brain peptide A1 n=1 Tax=Homo sapiens TaxID=9606 RepID=Q8NG36_HUMAN|nr:brain peptide A1 [Homo sapiens]
MQVDQRKRITRKGRDSCTREFTGNRVRGPQLWAGSVLKGSLWIAG